MNSRYDLFSDPKNLKSAGSVPGATTETFIDCARVSVTDALLDATTATFLEEVTPERLTSLPLNSRVGFGAEASVALVSAGIEKVG